MVHIDDKTECWVIKTKMSKVSSPFTLVFKLEDTDRRQNL